MNREIKKTRNNNFAQMYAEIFQKIEILQRNQLMQNVIGIIVVYTIS